MRGTFIHLVAAATLPVLGSISASHAAVSYTVPNSAVSQNFDSLPNTGSPSFVNDSTLPGWSLLVQPSPGTVPPSLATGDGSSNIGAFYSFGTTGSTERALGGTASGGAYFNSPVSGALAGWMAVAVTNNTGGALNSFNMSYDGEQWRNGGNVNAQTMALEYGFGTTFGGVSSWTAPGGSFDFVSPVTGATAASLNGNLPANRTAGLGGSVSSLNWSNGDTLWFRWIENNDIANDHGMGVDNFSFSAAAVPEPTTLGALALVAMPLIRRRRGSR